MTYRVEIEGLEVTPAHYGNYVEFKDRFEFTGIIVGIRGQFVRVLPWLATDNNSAEMVDPRDLRWS